MSSKVVRVLFIGNSYTSRNNLPGLITGLGAAASEPIEIVTRSIIANGMALKTHWDRGEALEAIREEEWDFVSLQEQSTLPLKNPARMHEYIERFDTEIRSRGGRTVLYLSWTRQNVPERQGELSEAYLSIGKKLGALVVPVGIVWQRALEEHPETRLYEKDGSHPTLAGSRLAAKAFFETLFGNGMGGQGD